MVLLKSLALSPPLQSCWDQYGRFLVFSEPCGDGDEKAHESDFPFCAELSHEHLGSEPGRDGLTDPSLYSSGNFQAQ